MNNMPLVEVVESVCNLRYHIRRDAFVEIFQVFTQMISLKLLRNEKEQLLQTIKQLPHNFKKSSVRQNNVRIHEVI